MKKRRRCPTNGSIQGDLTLYLELFFELVESTADFSIAACVFGDFFTGVEHGGVVFSSEGFSDIAEGETWDEFFAEVHGHLARDDDLPLPAWPAQVGDAHVEVFGDGALDLFEGDGFYFFVSNKITQDFFNHGERDFLFVEAAVCQYGDKGAFEFADVGGDIGGDEPQDFGGYDEVFFTRLVLKNGHAGFEVGRLDIHNEAPFEAGDEACLNALKFLGASVAGQDDLLVHVEEDVERVEEFFLGAFLSADEVDIVDHEDVHFAVFSAEFLSGLVHNALN